MFKQKLLWRLAIILLFIGFFNYLGSLLYLHGTVWWYDVVLHFLSGYSIGITTILFFQYFFGVKIPKIITVVLLASLFALIIGVLWEIFEVYVGFTSLSDGIIYVRDTSSDIIIDVCGGFFGALYSHKILNKNG